MKKASILLISVLIIYACNNKKNTPSVSNIKVDLSVKRFDQDFFSIDTNSVQSELSRLQVKYPDFLYLYLQNIVGINNDEGLKNYYRSYKPVFDSSRRIYNDFDPIKNEILKAFQYVKYYFPSYKTSSFLVPVIGPMNAKEDLARMSNGEYTPDFIGPDFIGISLQFYLGKDFSLYNTEYFVNTVAPMYRSRRFSKEYIIADVMKLVVDDLFPDKSNTLPLIEQMIEKGKQWWLLDKFLPDVPDSIKTGYTQHQLNWCRENEGLIWSYILKSNELNSINPATIQTYIGEGPFTQGFSQEDSPGNIGQWIGWQIVKKFAETEPDMAIDKLMKAAPKEILEKGKYKPK
jgi:hypothetical protein